MSSVPTQVPGAAGLYALNIDPVEATQRYRERVVGPVRGLLPEAAIASIEEQLSGACTVEIAAFGEFARLLGEPKNTEGFDHIVLDTAPTGHTLRLLALPGAWTGFFDQNRTGASCLGPMKGLQQERQLYQRAAVELSDPVRTRVVVVTRPEPSALMEAGRTSAQLAGSGMRSQHLVVNGIFQATTSDPLALAMERRGRRALEAIPAALAAFPRTEIPLSPGQLIGVQALRALGAETRKAIPASASVAQAPVLPALGALIEELASMDRGVVMALGKGGVGKTTIAAAIALDLARRGRHVHLTTTDPAAHVALTVGEPPPRLSVTRIDPQQETRAYTAEVLASAGEGLDSHSLALLEEDLRSPCTEEVAVFRAFARVVAEGQDGIVVIDTAPTGHTLLLLDAAESYHREVLRQSSGMPDAVRQLLPRLRDQGFTKTILITLPEATPVHEAAALRDELVRAGIEPFAWVINQSLAGLATDDPVLRARQWLELPMIAEVVESAGRVALLRWESEPPVGRTRLLALATISDTGSERATGPMRQSAQGF